MRNFRSRVTIIYWLIDTRPETIAAGWSNGKPFYCGKTVNSMDARLRGHQADALRYSLRKVGPIVLACGENLRIQAMEMVPAGDDWTVREKFWIAQVRLMNPDCANISDGGFGMTGYIATEETRRKQSAALTGKKRTPEQIERQRLRMTGKVHGPEMRLKVSIANKGKFISEETRAKMRLINLGRKHSPEARAKMSVAKSGKRRPLSEETKRKIGDANRGKVHSSEFRERISDRQRGRKFSDETRRRMAESSKKAYAEGRRTPRCSSGDANGRPPF